jgi:hypothetical protein
MWDYRSTRKPPPPQSESGEKADQDTSAQRGPDDGVKPHLADNEGKGVASKRRRDDDDSEKYGASADGFIEDRDEKRMKGMAANNNTRCAKTQNFDCGENS